MNNNTFAIESFISFCDGMMIAEEASFEYKVMRKVQTNTIALHKQLYSQKKEISKKFDSIRQEDDCDELIELLNKRKAGIQRKINGKEISDKKTLQKFIDLYNDFLTKTKEKRSKFENSGNASESFIDFCEDMMIAEESEREFGSVALEQRLTAAQRRALPDDAFGLPKERKYPLVVKDENGEYEWNHLKDAIAYFHTCKDEDKRKELAENIAKVIKKYNVDITIKETNGIRKYAKFD